MTPLLYPILEQYAKGGEQGGWLELPTEIVRGYVFFLANQVAMRRNLARCTDNKEAYAIAPFFSENGNFNDHLYNEKADGFYSALIFNDVLPLNVSAIPMEDVLRVAQKTRDERALHGGIPKRLIKSFKTFVNGGACSSSLELVFVDRAGPSPFVQGRPLRMRKITLLPGGVIGLHTHKDRPAVSYFLQGEVTYHQEGKPDVVVGPGQGFAEGKATTHWAENRGTMPAVWIAVDIPKG